MHNERSSPPLIYLFLTLPSGISSGFLSVTLAYELTKLGWSVAVIGSLVALGLSSHLWRFVWSPVIDLTLSTRAWYILGLVPSAIAIVAFGFVPLREGWFFTGLAFFSQVAATIAILPVSGMIAHTVKEKSQGRASGWYQAGNLGGAGIGGGLGVWLATHSTFTLACTVLSLIMLTCALALYWVPNVRPIPGDRIGPRIRAMGHDFKALIQSRQTLFVIALMTFPIGIGGASFLWSAVAPEWQASPDTVALVTGTLAGVLSAIGCVISGWLCDRVGRYWVLFGGGVLLALTAAVIAAVPHTPNAYRIGVLTYALLMGAPYAAFTAIILSAIGKGAASGKYAIIASIGNIPVVYMTALDGWAHDYWNASGMLYFEAIIAIPAIALGLLGLYLVRRPISNNPAHAAI
jgi:MFS transporter, PAT family, beta-lactamase induction signal transducer AmpG